MNAMGASFTATAVDAHPAHKARDAATPHLLMLIAISCLSKAFKDGSGIESFFALPFLRANGVSSTEKINLSSFFLSV
jgi:hypothetical protein